MDFMHLKIKIKEKFKLKTKLTERNILKFILYNLRIICLASKRRLNF